MIVCGLHDEGLRIAEQLDRAGVAVLLVDDEPDPRLLRWAGSLGLPYLAGDSRLPETLEAAGLPGATALVCVETDDLHTLATALLARELREDLRVVVQLGNPAVGRALMETGVAVLDVARLSAPALVESCLRSGRQPLDLGGHEFVVVETVCPHAGTLRSLYGDLSPIAVLPEGARHVEVAPSRDRPVAAGDQAWVAGTPAELAGHGLAPVPTRQRPEFVGARAMREREPRPVALWRYTLRTLDRRIRRALLALAALVVVSTGVLMLGYEEAGGRRMSVLDALYFTVETIGTVGYGDFSFRDQQPGLRLWAIGLMIVGATLATVFFALLTNMLVSRRLEEALGRRQVTGLTGHVVVIGLGAVGLDVVDRLQRSGTPAVVVDVDEDNRFLPQLRARGVPVVLGDATLPESLALLRLEHARAVAVVTSDDLVNIETGLAVRDLLAALPGDRWAEVPVVLRLFDRRLANTVEGSFGFRFVRSTAALAAPWFVGAALGLDVLSTFYVADEPMLVARIRITTGGLDGRAMQDLSARIRVLSLVRADGSEERPPRRDTRLAAGDTAYLVGPYDELLAVLRLS